MKKPKKKHSVLRVRRTNKTDRDNLGTKVVPDKKKENQKRWCRKNEKTE